MVRLVSLWLVVLAVLSGCAALPAAGPSATEVVERAKTQDGQGTTPYDVVDIDPRVVDIMRTRRPASFYARFGDYRAPVEPRIGAGDTISVTIWEASANGLFSAPLPTDRFTTGAKSATFPDQVVGRDGAISIPYGGRIRVAGDTPAAVQDAIEQALQGKAVQPQVLVGVTHQVSSTATVTGEVGAAGRIPLSTRGDRLLDVIAGAGGVRIPVNEASVRLSRGRLTLSVPLARVVADPRENIFMIPRDTVTIVREPETFIASGATGRNDEIAFGADNITLSQALAKMGGILDHRADPAGVFLFRYEPDSVATALTGAKSSSAPTRAIVYRLDLRDPNGLFLAQRFPMFDKDVVYVSNAPVTDLQKALLAFNLIASPIATGAEISTLAK